MANFYQDNEALRYYLHHPLMKEIVALRERDFSESSQFDYAPLDYADAMDSYERVLDIVGEKEYIIDWIKKRLAHLDRTLMRHPCDVDSDGAVTAFDISAILTYLLDGTGYDSNFDVNGDGFITSSDLGMLYDFVLGLNQNE